MCNWIMRNCNTRKKKLIFFSETYTTSGCKPDKNKVTAITKLPAPNTTRNKYNHVIGMINYLSKFLARLSKIAEPISELAKRQGTFQRGPEHQSVFTQMKNEIASALILAYYNPKKHTVFTNWCKHKRFRHMLTPRRKNQFILLAKP